MDNSLVIENTVENVIIEEKKIHAKRGRKAGWKNETHYKWEVTIFDKSTNKFIRGKYLSVEDINEKLGLTLNSDYVRRIRTGFRADTKMRNGVNSFFARWGNIEINKINEKISQ
jgi:hypothetical protein